MKLKNNPRTDLMMLFLAVLFIWTAASMQSSAEERVEEIKSNVLQVAVTKNNGSIFVNTSAPVNL